MSSLGQSWGAPRAGKRADAFTEGVTGRTGGNVAPLESSLRLPRRFGTKAQSQNTRRFGLKGSDSQLPFPGKEEVPWVRPLPCPGHGSRARRPAGLGPAAGRHGEANRCRLVQAAFAVPAGHCVALLVASEEMFARRAALEIV